MKQMIRFHPCELLQLPPSLPESSHSAQTATRQGHRGKEDTPKLYRKKIYKNTETFREMFLSKGQKVERGHHDVNNRIDTRK
jgi:hypothetical protein